MQTRHTERLENWSIGIVASLTAALVLAILVLASVPPVDRDALTHHLAVPKLYLKHGGLVEIPWVPFSYYPMNLDLFFLLPLWLGNDIIPKYIHFAFGLLTAGWIFTYLKRRANRPLLGFLGALLFLSLPLIVKLSTTVYVDLGLIFFSTASLLQLFRWASTGFAWRHLVIAGILCGLALGTKYNGLISFLLLACFTPVVYLRSAGVETIPRLGESTSHGSKKARRESASLRAIGYGAVFAAVALLVFSPWMIRNYVWTRNPVYPLYDQLFNARDPISGSDGVDVPDAGSESDSSGLNPFALRRLVFNESLLETLTIPIRIFFQGKDDNPKYFDGSLNPYLFFFPVLAFFGFRRLSRRHRLESILLAAFSVLYLLFAFLQADMRIRYVAPIIAPLTILAVLGFNNLLVAVKKKVPSPAVGLLLAGGVCALFLASNFQYTFDQFRKVEPLDYISGAISRDDYIQRFRPEYATYRYINQRLPEKARVLGVFLGNRLYYCDRELVCDATLDAAVRTAGSADALARILRAKEFSHIMIRSDLFEHYILRRLSPDKANLLQTFLSRYTHRLFSQDGFYLMELKD